MPACTSTIGSQSKGWATTSKWAKAGQPRRRLRDQQLRPFLPTSPQGNIGTQMPGGLEAAGLWHAAPFWGEWARQLRNGQTHQHPSRATHRGAPMAGAGRWSVDWLDNDRRRSWRDWLPQPSALRRPEPLIKLLPRRSAGTYRRAWWASILTMSLPQIDPPAARVGRCVRLLDYGCCDDRVRK
jgi:hypothetical protein